MRIGFRVRVTLLALLLPFAGGAPIAAETTTAETVKLPLTFDKIWFRAPNKKGLSTIKTAKATGHLTLTPDSLEFASSKQTFSLPLERLRLVSMGRLGGDVDTEWVLLSVEESGIGRVIGVRDGSSLGYGAATRDIYESLRAGLKQLSAAQYDVPDGLDPYDALDRQLVFGIPSGWSAYAQEVHEGKDRPTWGLTLFSPERIDRQDPDDRAVAVRRARRGDLEAFFLGRHASVRGMRCEGFSDNARAELLELVDEDPLFGEGYRVTQAPETTPIEIGGCSGLRVYARSRESGGIERALEYRAVSEGGTLYVFGVRSDVETLDVSVAAMEQSIRTVRFAIRDN